MISRIVVCIALLMPACAHVDYSKSCDGVGNLVKKTADADKKLAALAQGYLDACNGDMTCVDSVISAFLPINVLTQSTYRFAESLQRGGLCSPEAIAIVEEHVKKIEEIYREYTK